MMGAEREIPDLLSELQLLSNCAAISGNVHHPRDCYLQGESGLTLTQVCETADLLMLETE